MLARLPTWALYCNPWESPQQKFRAKCGRRQKQGREILHFMQEWTGQSDTVSPCTCSIISIYPKWKPVSPAISPLFQWSFHLLIPFFNVILQQWWWITTIIRSSTKPCVIDGGCLEEQNKARRGKKRELLSCIHECCFIWKKHTDKGLTLKPGERKIVSIYTPIPTRAQNNKISKKTKSEETLK